VAIVKLGFDESVEREELGERGLPCSLKLLSLVTYSAIRSKEDQLLAGKVNLQPNNSWVSAMHRKPK